MALDTSFETGFGGDATINGKRFPVVQWSGQFPATIQRYVNSKSGGHPVRAATVTDFTGTIVLDYNQSDQPFQSSQGALIPGTIVSSLYLQLSTTANDGIAITNVIITDTPVSCVIDGKIALSLNVAISGGTITMPAGTAY